MKLVGNGVYCKTDIASSTCAWKCLNKKCFNIVLIGKFKLINDLIGMTFLIVLGVVAVFLLFLVSSWEI